MAALRVGFEASKLVPKWGGLYTYSSQLLRRLVTLDDRPDIVLLDVVEQVGLEALLQANEGTLPTRRYARARPLPHLGRLVPGDASSPSGRVASAVDNRTLLQLWKLLEGHPDTVPARLLARWRLPYRYTGRLDVCHWPFEDAFVYRPGVAHVMTIHDLIVLRHPEWFPSGYVRDHTLRLTVVARLATRIIADSESTRCDAINLLGIKPDRIDVIPLAAGPEFHPPTELTKRDEVLRRYGLRQDGYVLSVGTVSVRKNVVRLAEAFKVVMEREPGLSLQLVLAGQFPSNDSTIVKELRALQLGSRLLLPGMIPSEDLPALLNGARVVAYISLYEGFGLPPLEAMSCGAAVVASNNSSLPEVVGDMGLLVDPYNIAQIAAALQRVMTDDALRDVLVGQGLVRAAQFSWAKTAELTMESYRRAVAARQRLQQS